LKLEVSDVYDVSNTKARSKKYSTVCDLRSTAAAFIDAVECLDVKAKPLMQYRS
jgi:hypothetical protein